jgi:hypothetical protein
MSFQVHKQIYKYVTWTNTRPLQMNNCDRGDMKLGLLAVLLPALKILAIRFVLVNSAAYTTVKQKPAPNLGKQHTKKNYK